MIVRAIDSDNDWQFGKGKNDYKQNLNAVAQNIKTRLQSFLNDCFFDTTAGIDWFNLLGGKNQIALNLAINATILNTLNVTGLNQISVTLDANRVFRVQYNVQTSYSLSLAGDFSYDIGTM